MCVKKFIFSKFGGLQAYGWQLYYQMNSSTGIFQQHFKPPMLPLCIDLSPLPSNFEEPPPCSQHLWETLPQSFSQFRLCKWVLFEQVSLVWADTALIKAWTGIGGLTITDFLLFILHEFVYCG